MISLNVFSLDISYSIDDLPNVIYVTGSDTLCLPLISDINGVEPNSYDFYVDNKGVEIIFDSVNNIFKYIGSDDVKEPFIVNFSSVYNDTTFTKSIEFVPRLEVIPEQNILSLSSKTLPYLNSTSYFSIVEHEGEKNHLNNVDRDTRIIEVRGYTVIIDEDEALWDFQNNENIEAMSIICDSLVIRKGFNLPQTNISIKSRIIVFIDQDAEVSVINTTPLSLSYAALNASLGDTIGGSGLDGLDAGSIEVYTEELIIAENQTSPRFIANGGNGQDAGLGLNGEDGYSMQDLGSGMVYHYYEYYSGWSKKKVSVGTKAWPGDGQDAIAPGKPGEPGSGGDISFNIVMDKIYENQGGESGEAGEPVVGGEAGEPINSSWAIKKSSSGPYAWTTHTSYAGVSFTEPTEANLAKGSSGDVNVSDDRFKWVCSQQARLVLIHGKDVYLEGNSSYTYQQFSDYIDAITNYFSTDGDNLNGIEYTALLSIRQEMESICTRIESNKDYFGNVYGYAPYLSYEFLFQNYQNEVERSLNIMYLVYIINNVNTTIEEKRDALNAIKSEKISNCEDLILDYKESNLAIQELTYNIDDIVRNNDSLKVELKGVEDVLIRLASHNLNKDKLIGDIKQVADLAGTVCNFVPGLQGVGVALTAVSNLDVEDPLSFDNFMTVGGAYLDIKDLTPTTENSLSGILESVETSFDAVVNVDVSEYINDSDYRETLNSIFESTCDSIQPYKDLYEDLKESYNPITVSNTSLQAELDRLKASSSEFQKLLTQISNNAVEHQLEFDKLIRAHDNISRNQQEILQSVLAIDMLNKELSTQLNNSLSSEMLSYIQDMEQRAKETLLKYHYLVAKGYEYRMITKYPNSLDISGIYDQFLLLLEEANSAILSKEDYSSLIGIYDDQISRIIAEILTEKDFTGKSSTMSFSLDQESLDQLNERGMISINPVKMGLIFDEYEDVRLLNISVGDVEYTTSSLDYSFLVSRISFQHSGVSTFLKDGTPYTFYNISNNNTSPHTWTSILDANSETINHEVPSPLNTSLLNSILASNGNGDSDINLFSSPALNSDIIIKKSDRSNTNTSVQLESLDITITYSYSKGNDKYTELKISSNVDGAPCYLDKTDRLGRKNGYGNIRRSFARSRNDVTLTVLENYGDYRFENWTSEGKILGSDVFIKLETMISQNIVANYVLWRSSLSLLSDTIKVTSDNQTVSNFITSSSQNKNINWEVLEYPSWIQLQDVTGIGEGSLKMLFSSNNTDSIRESFIVIANSDVISDLDTIVLIQDKGVSYTVKFADWDGTTLAVDTVLDGSNATAPSQPTRTGYTFSGWDTTLDNVSTNYTVTAEYTINSYVVRFVDFDGTNIKTESVNYGSDATAPSSPTRTGYTFSGWDMSFTNVSADYTITAQYIQNTTNAYIITFVDWDGVTLKAEAVNEGDDAVAPSDPVRSGYTFTGWSTSFTNVTESYTVTAQYVMTTYTITFAISDGNTMLSNAVLHFNDVDYFSDANGIVIVNNILESKYKFTISASGFTTLDSTLMVDNDKYINIIMPTTSAIGELVRQEVKLYPNPAISAVTIEGAGNCDVRIYTLAGQMVVFKGIASEREVLDISCLQSGVYILTAGDFTTRLIVN